MGHELLITISLTYQMFLSIVLRRGIKGIGEGHSMAGKTGPGPGEL